MQLPRGGRNEKHLFAWKDTRLSQICIIRDIKNKVRGRFVDRLFVDRQFVDRLFVEARFIDQQFNDRIFVDRPGSSNAGSSNARLG
jgi:hypothetical protein